MKKAFTLVELLGVIIILGVISLITYPIIDKSIKNSKQQALEQIINNIEEAAYNYSVENDIGYSTEYQNLQLSELISKGFLKENIINPVTDEQMQGCVLYRWDDTNNQYIFEYDEECNKIETEPIVNITYNKELINNNGWAKENIAVTITGNGEIKYCISSSECEPNEVVETGNNTKFITTEGTSYICAIVSNSLGNSGKKCEIIKLDKTMPTINGINDIIVNKGEEINLTEGISVTDGLSGIEGNYSYNPMVIDNNVVGITTVTYKVLDKAGNETIKERKVEVIGEAPNITFTSTGTANSNGWYKENIYVKGNIVDNSKKGIKSIKWCSTTGTECTPNTLTEEINVLINNESSTNKICVEVIDNNNKVTTKCSDVYKLDKTLPIIEGIGDKVVQRGETVNLKEGVTYKDSLSGIEGDIIITPSSVDTSITGTKQVTYKLVDKAGNVREVIRNIIVDAEAPTIVYNLVNPSSINSNGWAKNNFYVRATITDNSGSGINNAKSCSTNSSSECSPVASFTGNTKDFYVEVEGSNRLCIEVTDNNNKTSKVCSDTYKLDKTAPVAGTATFTGTLGSNNWYTSNVTINKINGSDSLSGHSSTTSNITSITSNTAGTTVTITTTDLAGNSSTRNYTIKVDKNSPTLTDKGGNISIYQGDSNIVSNYFTVNYSISGGSISCSPVNTSGLNVGTQTVSCTATGGNGRSISISKQINVKAKPVSFATDSWETIADAVRNNNTSAYHVGDTKEVTLTSIYHYAGTYTVRIANMSTPSECSTSGFSQTACGFVIEFVDIIANDRMNSTNTNLGGWPASSMYNFVNTEIYNALPSDLQKVIINTYSVSGHGINESVNFTSIDKLYLLSPKEVWGKDGTSSIINYDSAEAETRQLDYYKNNGVTTSSYSKARKLYQGQGSTGGYWWLRSAVNSSDFSTQFYSVSNAGSCQEELGASNSFGVSPAFRIG